MNARRRLERELTLVLTRLRALEDSAAGRPELVERLEQLHDALDRVENDTYGLCIECDHPIHEGRLRTRPEAETCVRCEERRARDLTSGRRIA